MDMSSGGKITDTGGRTGHTHPASDVDALAASAITAQGQILVGTGPSTYAPLPPGTAGQAIIVDETTQVGLAYADVAPLVHTHTQQESHQSVDTDQSGDSLHHTLGTGAFQAAPGDHTHTDIIPVGAITAYVGMSAPPGWLLCDGSVVSSTQYPTLSSVCAGRFGQAQAGFFRLPDLKSRFPVGVDTSTSTFAAPGSVGGQQSVTLTTANMPSHNHSIPSHDHTTQAHQHALGSHDHTAPAHSHTVTLTSDGNHTHSVSASIPTGGDHGHDTRITDVSGVRGDKSGQLANRLGTNTGNSTAQSTHSHSVSVSQTTTGSHTHTASVSSAASGSTGSASVSCFSEAVFVNQSAATSTGDQGQGTPVTLLNPFLAVNFIIKADE